MRSTIDILCDVKDNIDVDKEELRIAILVLDEINFFNHNYMRRLLKGGLAAELAAREFSDKGADLGISEAEYKALQMDPIEYLGTDRIPGTPEWEIIHKTAQSILDKILKEIE